MTIEQEKQWIAAWRRAGPKLQEIRDEELRQRSNKGVRSVDGHVVYDSAPHLNGMVIMQAWFQRFQILLSQESGRQTTDCSGEGKTSG